MAESTLNAQKTKMSSGLCFASLIFALSLFFAEIDLFNKVNIKWGSVVAVILFALLVTGVARWLLFSRLPAYEVSHIDISVIKEAVAITGTVFALFAGKIAAVSLTKSANSNVATVYGQLYQWESKIDDEEGNDPAMQSLYSTVSLWEVYNYMKAEGTVSEKIDNCVKSSDTAKDSGALARLLCEHIFSKENIATATETYCKLRLWKLIESYEYAAWQPEQPDVKHKNSILGPIKTPELLQEFIYRKNDVLLVAGNANGEALSRKQRLILVKILGKSSAHVIRIMNQLHLAHDYAARKLIPEGDIDTWFPYLQDIGPHPLVLMNVNNWLDMGYCTKEYFDDVQYALSGRYSITKLLGAKCKECGRKRKEYEILNRSVKDIKAKVESGTEYLELAEAILKEKLTENERDDYLLTLLGMAAYDRYVMARPEYRELVDDLTKDMNGESKYKHE